MSDQVNSEQETPETSGLLLSVEPVEGDTSLSARPADDSDAADTGDGKDTPGVDADGTDAADADGTDVSADTDSTDADGTDATDNVGDDTDTSDADGSDS